MPPLITSRDLRQYTEFYHGRDLMERLRVVHKDQEQMKEAIAKAADEIDRLNARIHELEAALQGMAPLA